MCVLYTSTYVHIVVAIAMISAIAETNTIAVVITIAIAVTVAIVISFAILPTFLYYVIEIVLVCAGRRSPMRCKLQSPQPPNAAAACILEASIGRRSLAARWQ